MVSFITTLLLFALIISVIVVVHELGHYIAARITGMEVEEFALGMGPVVWQKKHSESKHVAKVLDFLVFRRVERQVTIGDVTERVVEEEMVMETVPAKSAAPPDQLGNGGAEAGHVDTNYMIKLFPIGGYVKILGEEEENATTGSFSQKSVWARMLVACAGVVMNMLLGAVFFYVVLIAKGFVYDSLPYYDGFQAVFGTQQVEYAYPVTVMGVIEDTPAEEAGFKAGWEILEVDGEKVASVEELKSVVGKYAGSEVNIGINTEDQKSLTVAVTVSDEGTIGVELAQDFKVLKISYNGIERVFAGFLHEVNMLKANVFILGRLVKQSVEERTVAPVAQSVAGPVGLVAVIDIVKKYGGIVGIVDLIGMFNVALVMMNILPFPALDGGHVMFLGIEAVRGRPVNPKLQQGLFTVGMILLFAFMIVVSAKDVFQFGIWDWFKGLFGG
jgi:regulator of sigma E protease